MNNSIHDVMNDLVAVDAARLSGRVFADARGGGIARRVRTRRTVRAAGVGGFSAVAVGSLALGAAHVPWGTLGAAGLDGAAGTDCVTQSASDDAYAYELLVRKGDTPGYTASLIDTATGATFLTATLQPDGTYVFTDVDGNSLKATPEETFFSTDVDGNPLMSAADELYAGYWVIGPQASPEDWGEAPRGAAEIVVKSVSTTDFVGLPSAVARALDDCYTPSPIPSEDPNMEDGVSQGPDPTLAAKPEDVIGDSPFECGFEFPTESYGTDALSIDSASWMAPDEAMAAVELEYGTDAFAGLTAPASDVASASALVLSAPSFELTGVNIDLQTGEPGVEKTDHMVLTDSTEVGVSAGMTFVATKDGKVVATGTLPGGPHSVDAPIVVGFGASEGASADIYLIDAAKALSPCDASPVDLANVELYAIAGTVTRHFDGSVDPTIYAWAQVAKS